MCAELVKLNKKSYIVFILKAQHNNKIKMTNTVGCTYKACICILFKRLGGKVISVTYIAQSKLVYLAKIYISLFRCTAKANPTWTTATISTSKFAFNSVVFYAWFHFISSSYRLTKKTSIVIATR